jgi:hypothetical protein
MLGLRGFMVSLDTGLSVSRFGSGGALEEATEPDTDFQVLRIDLRTLVFSDERVVGDDGCVGVRGIVVAGIGDNPLCGGGGPS